ncbi:MAG: LysR family transcriptional regulator [Coriobacteriia bacterium]|nr:LysR family transcriptional regulator [Coriobacteriia bacterium]
MNITQLEYFLAVAHSRKFSAAAEQMYVSQSCLSKQIKALEDELDVELFVRSSSGVTLTAAGEMFLDFAQKMHRTYERALASLAQYTTSAAVSIRVGALPLMNEYDLHADIADFQLDNMGIQIDFHERNQGELISRLKMDRLDLAVLRTDLLSPEEYEWHPIVRDDIVVICSNAHPLARRIRVTPEDLKNERFVMLDAQSAITHCFCDVCRSAGFFPNITYTHQRHEPLVAAVSRGLGISVLPRQLAMQSRHSPELACVPFQEPFHTDVGIVWQRDKELSPPAASLVEHFQRRYPAALETSS